MIGAGTTTVGLAGLTLVCDCDGAVFGDFLIIGELGMRFVVGGLVLLAGSCGGLSAPLGLGC